MGFNNLRQLRKARKISQKELADQLHVGQSAISNWENGTRDMDSATLVTLAKFFDVSTDFLLGTDSLPEDRQSAIHIPVLGRVPAGIPIEAVQDILDYEEISPEMAATGEYFALRVAGDSMAPRMRNGDVVIVRCQSDVTSGDVAVIIINGSDATVKRVLKKENGIVLQPSNPGHEPLFFTQDEIRDLPVIIVGRVVELRAKL